MFNRWEDMKRRQAYLDHVHEEYMRVLTYGNYLAGTPVATEAGIQSQEAAMAYDYMNAKTCTPLRPQQGPAQTRGTVTIEGRAVTREVVEKAMRELNRPPVVFRAGDRVRFKQPLDSQEFVVVTPKVAEAHRRMWPTVMHLNEEVVLVGLSTGDSYSPHPDCIEHVERGSVAR